MLLSYVSNIGTLLQNFGRVQNIFFFKSLQYVFDSVVKLKHSLSNHHLKQWCKNVILRCHYSIFENPNNTKYTGCMKCDSILY